MTWFYLRGVHGGAVGWGGADGVATTSNLLRISFHSFPPNLFQTIVSAQSYTLELNLPM